jgi:hypothetical protein
MNHKEISLIRLELSEAQNALQESNYHLERKRMKIFGY